MGYNIDSKYTNNKLEIPKTGKRNIIWFNPTFSITISTNVTKTLLQLVTKYFPRGHKLHNIFDHSTVKVSYSCMNNTSKIIKRHNKKVTSKSHDQTTKSIAEKKQNAQWNGAFKLMI